MENKTKGSGLIFAVVLMFVILGMVITLSSITVLETKMSQKTKSSVGAFYNADSGVEWGLNLIANPSGPNISNVFTGTSAMDSNGKISCPNFGTSTNPCSLYLLDKDGKVITSNLTIAEIKAVRSVGTQGGETQRAIEAAVAASMGYQMACSNFLTNEGKALSCCQINTITGAAECKVTRCLVAGTSLECGSDSSWHAFSNRPFDASVNGNYQISCNYLSVNGGKGMSCCRTTIAGATECKYTRCPIAGSLLECGSDTSWYNFDSNPF